MINFIVLVVIIAIVTLIAVQNAAPVVLSFLFWKVEISLSVIIFCSVFTGIIIAAVFLLSGYIKRIRKSRRKPEEQQKGGDG